MIYGVIDTVSGDVFEVSTDSDDMEAALLAHFPDAPMEVRDSVGQLALDMLHHEPEASGALDYLALRVDYARTAA